MMETFDPVWEEIHSQREWGKYPSESVIRFVARNYYHGDRAKTKILDFGCGAGSNTWYLAREGFDTFAFDGSKSAVGRVQKRLEEEHLEADLRVRDALNLDYEQESFDCIIDNAVIYANLSENIRKMFEEVYGLLKKGGKLFSVSFSTNTTGYGIGKRLEENTYSDIQEGCLADRGTAHFFDKKELHDILNGCGFLNIRIDTLAYTDNGALIEQFLVQAER